MLKWLHVTFFLNFNCSNCFSIILIYRSVIFIYALNVYNQQSRVAFHWSFLQSVHLLIIHKIILKEPVLLFQSYRMKLHIKVIVQFYDNLNDILNL